MKTLADLLLFYLMFVSCHRHRCVIYLLINLFDTANSKHTVCISSIVIVHLFVRVVHCKVHSIRFQFTKIFTLRQIKCAFANYRIGPFLKDEFLLSQYFLINLLVVFGFTLKPMTCERERESERVVSVVGAVLSRLRTF